MNAAYQFKPVEHATKTIETLSGNVIDFENLVHAVTPFDEIALVMSRLPVNNGHQVAHSTYSLAHHCLWVMRYVLWITGSPKAAMYALVYRAHEAYLGSIPAPIKALSYLHAPLDHLTSTMQNIVHINMGLDKPNADTLQTIHDASAIASALESEKFLPSRNYQQYINKIPEAAREIAWDYCDNSAIFEEMMSAYNVLIFAIKEQEADQ